MAEHVPAPPHWATSDPGPISEQQLLSNVSHLYHGDASLQQLLWDMISDGVIRTEQELKLTAEGHVRRREVAAGQLASSGMPRAQTSRPQSSAQQQPNQKQATWDTAHQLPTPMDVSGQHQVPGSLSQSLDFGARNNMLMHHKNLALSRQQAHHVPPPPLQHAPTAGGLPRVSHEYHSIPHYPKHDMEQQGQDLDILSRSFDAIHKLAAAPAYGQHHAMPSQTAHWPGQQRSGVLSTAALPSSHPSLLPPHLAQRREQHLTPQHSMPQVQQMQYPAAIQRTLVAQMSFQPPYGAVAQRSWSHTGQGPLLARSALPPPSHSHSPIEANSTVGYY